MIVVDRSYKPKPFFCECGSALGIITRDTKRIVRLSVFRDVMRGSMIDMYLDFPDGGLSMFGHALYSVMGMNDGIVLCQWCARECKWEVKRQALDEMINRLAGSTYG